MWMYVSRVFWILGISYLYLCYVFFGMRQRICCFLSNHHERQLLLLMGLPSRTWQKDFIAEDTTQLYYRTWINQADSDLEASFLLSSFLSAACYKKNKISNSLAHQWSLWASWITNLHKKLRSIIVARLSWAKQLLMNGFKVQFTRYNLGQEHATG